MVTIDITQLRLDIRNHCGVSDTAPDGFDNDKCDLLANRTLWALFNKYPFRETEKSVVWNTVAGERSYATPTLFEALRKISIEDPDSLAHIPLNRMTIDTYESVYINHEDAEGFPTDYVRDGNCVLLYPTPDDIYPITFKHWILLADIEDANPGFPLPLNWYEIVMYGAVSRGFLSIRNTTQAAEFENLQVKCINDTTPVEAKEEIDSPRAGVSVRGYHPGDIYNA